MSISRCRIGATVAIALVLTQATAIAQTADNDWRWSITPYLWGSDIKTDIRFPTGQAVGATTRFSDLVDKLDFAAQVHAEGQRGQWGLFADATFLSLSDDTTFGPISADTEIETGIYEFGTIFTPGGEGGRFTAMVGVRIIDLSLDTTFSVPAPIGPVRRTADKSFTDVFIGGRFVHSFNDRWVLNVRGDAGAGNTDSDWNALAFLGWRFGRDLNKAVLFGWRHMEIEVEEAGRETEVTLDGPIVGVRFGF